MADNKNIANLVAEKTAGVLNGLTGIIAPAVNMADINNTSGIDSQINNIGRIGSYDYGSFDNIVQDYARLGYYQPDLSYNNIRGGSVGERIGGVLSSTLSGATAGLTVGGPWGALAGGVIGLGAGAAGWLSGEGKYRSEYERLKANSSVALDNANKNISAGLENYNKYNFRSSVIPNTTANGGNIERKSQSLKDFGESVLRKRKYESSRPSLIRRHGEGGTIIRIKR